MQLISRKCPICNTVNQNVFCDDNIDPSKLNEFAFASRKNPELMRHRLMRCGTCDLIYADPAPSVEFLKIEYQQSSFDSSEEAACAARTYRKYLPDISRSGKVLDIGTGGGEFLGELLSDGFLNIEGIEPSLAAIATAKQNIRPLIREGMFVPENYPPSSFGLVSCFQTLEHVMDPLTVSKSAHQLLENGGKYYTISHNVHGGVNKLLGRKSPIYDIEHLQLFSPKSLKCLLENAGFTHISIFPIWNSYPLHYWVKLLPLPNIIKIRAMALLKLLKIGYIRISLPVGNLAAVATK